MPNSVSFRGSPHSQGKFKKKKAQEEQEGLTKEKENGQN